MDMAIVKGRVSQEPQFIKNGGEIRCQINLIAELIKKKDVVVETVYAHILATTEPSLSERCKAYLEKDDEIMIMGDFGFHKGRLKMRVKDISLPPVEEVAATPPASDDPIIC